MIPQETLDAVLVSALERLSINAPWKLEDLKGGFSRNILWRIKEKDSPGVVIRVVPVEKLGRLRRHHDALMKCDALGLPVSKPLFCEEFGLAGVMATSYIDGEDGGIALPKFDTETLEETGLTAGWLLRQIHTLPATEPSVGSWARRRILKYERYQEKAYQQQLRFADQDRIEDFIEDNIAELAQGSVSFQHDDFHPRNLIFRDQSLVGVIDFDNCDSGDPVEDFYKVPWFTLPISETFASAQIEGYLEDNPIENFWLRYNLAVAMSITSSLVWAHGLEDRKMLQDFQYRIMEIVNTHDFTDGGPPVWY